MEYLEKVKEYLLKGGTKKNMQNLIILFIIGLIIVITANYFTPQAKTQSGYVEVKDNKQDIKNTAISYEEKLNTELTAILSKIEGVGKVTAMIYFESGNEMLPAYNQNNSVKTTEENDGNGGKRITNENNNNTTIVTTNENGGNRPFITKEYKPKISGIIVIAEGANNPEVKYKLYEAVKTVFNMQQYKVNIYPMEKTK